ncbi:DNA-binding transcriptional ArsR family regulator [Methanomicrobium sp. W14]|uniref:FHA domain-containing protein n=1 Tax=Methanomicrobium sp. W14 TaxID=2817839 RepID=UPI001AE8AF45|nr:FHA domain-containing protein [Methanomicrobium sp. W14]MBP2134283.1 DNA-binding transcriptional ArsR family regulator [Methanomicrobium sp. W14]
MSDELNENTIAISNDPDFYKDLSEYLNVLSNPTRLKILKLIEHQPKEVREIAKEIDTSYENTKKHLDKLLNTGVIKKEAGMGRQTSKGSLPVWKYSLIPGGMEGIIRNLSIFSNIDIRIGEEELNSKLKSVRSMLENENKTRTPVLIILGGDDDGKAWPLEESEVKIGREDQSASDIEKDGSVVLSPSYEAVTRVTKPHGRFIKRGDDWYFEDCRSTGGSYINNKKIQANRQTPIKDGDMLDLARGAKGARLIFNLG